MGTPVNKREFVFGLTCEKYGDIRTQKLRVLIIDKELLEKYFVPNAPSDPDKLGVVVDIHRDRITTLKVMGGLFTSDEGNRYLNMIEVGLPA